MGRGERGVRGRFMVRYKGREGSGDGIIWEDMRGEVYTIP